MTTRLLHHFRGNDEGEICGCLVRDGRGVALVMLTGSGHKAITILAQKMKNFAMIQDMQELVVICKQSNYFLIDFFLVSLQQGQNMESNSPIQKQASSDHLQGLLSLETVKFNQFSHNKTCQNSQYFALTHKLLCINGQMGHESKQTIVYFCIQYPDGGYIAHGIIVLCMVPYYMANNVYVRASYGILCIFY